MNELIKSALIRAVRTIVQVTLSLLTVDGSALYIAGLGVTDIDWLHILNVAILAGIYSFLLSIYTGLPEAGNEPVEMTEDEAEELIDENPELLD